MTPGLRARIATVAGAVLAVAAFAAAYPAAAVARGPGRPRRPGFHRGGPCACRRLAFGGSRSSLYAHFSGTTWSLVRGATPLHGMLESFTVTAHIPGTDATWGVGGTTVGFINDVKPFRAIIEFNPG